MREFMYVDDAANAVVQALEKYDDVALPLNIGTGSDISIKQLVEYIVAIVGYEGEVVWNTDKPDGQMKKLLSVDRMKELIELDPMNIRDGLAATIKWYVDNKEKADAKA